ncbi:ATPase [Candidatus Vecturithrix granuli]|uniref:ATPase n=1 Tax=Vecturithrix granuli TaxID=1499967 RepID=A0A0S6W6G0_VECG1|nr:ATPase [Candidatus Vecturithrix granuli]
MVNLATLPRRLIVTGLSGSGKTMYCQQVIAAAKSAGWRIAGILSPPRFAEGQKTGIFAVDLASGATRLLASCVPVPDEIKGVRFGKWVFDRDALAWGNELLFNLPASDLLVVDEIGPLEFDLQQGWPVCFQAISRPFAAITLATVRPAYLPQLQTFWRESVTLHVETQKYAPSNH